MLFSFDVEHIMVSTNSIYHYYIASQHEILSEQPLINAWLRFGQQVRIPGPVVQT